MISYLYDKQLVAFGAATGLSIIYMVVILPISILIYSRIMKKNYLYRNKMESYAGLVLAIVAVVLILLNAFDVNLGIYIVSLYTHIVVAIIGIAIVFYGLYVKRLEYTGTGLLFVQKTIDAVILDNQIAQLVSIAIWIMILILIIFYTIELSSRKRL